MAGSTSNKATSTQSSSQSTQSGLDSEQFEKLLEGYEDRSEVEGRLARAMTIEGNQVLVLVGPKDLEAGGSVEAEDSDIRDRFQEGGFTGVEILEEARIARAELDDDHYIFALSADQISGSGMQIGSAGTTGSTAMGQTDTQSGTTGTQSGSTTTGQTDTTGSTTMGQTDTQSGTTGTQSGSTTMSQTDTQTGTAGTGQVGRALSEPDAERIVSDLDEAGVDDAKEFKGRLLRASTEDGADVFFIITSKDMESDAEIDISEDEVRSKLEEANLEDIEFIDDAKVVRGSLDDDDVFVLAGDLMGIPQ
jgi:hypothetical protein